MHDYVATFFSHYDASAFYGHLKDSGVAARLMPVPRKLSASCGTCVSFGERATEMRYADFEVEAVFARRGEGFDVVWAME